MHTVNLGVVQSCETRFAPDMGHSIRATLPETQPVISLNKSSFRIRNARDHPSSVDTNKIEQVCATVIDLPIDEKMERGPHHGEIVFDPDQRIVNALFNLGLTRFSYALREAVKGHLRGLPVAHQHHRAAGNVGASIAAASRFDMPSNVAWIGASAACSSADCAKVRIATLVVRIAPKKKMNCFACMFMPAILSSDRSRKSRLHPASARA